MSDRIKMFIGTSSNGEDNPIEAVYEYTLRKNCSKEIDIVWMRQTNNEDSFWYGFNTVNWPTPFSGYRWAIAEYCGFKGRAIYTDCDMINFRDINELWEFDMKGKPLAARKGSRFGGHEFCVTVIDCEKFKELDPVSVSRQRNLDTYHQRCIRSYSGNESIVEELDPRWNCLDGEGREIEDIWQLHWTKMATQPWKPSWFTGENEEHNREDLISLFYSLKYEANQAGYNGQLPEVPKIKYEIIGR